MSSLKMINFSNGIRSKEIQENFEYLENVLKENRLSITGSGIVCGLTISTKVSNDNTLCAICVSDGELINNDGELISINGEFTKDVEIPQNGYGVIHSLCINQHDEVCLYCGTESTSPSEYDTASDSDVKYRIGTVTITASQDGTISTRIINSTLDKVNIYTDEQGELYLNGIQFSTLGLIRLAKPEEPKENDIWLDTDYWKNELYIYQTINGVSDWYPLRRYDTKQLKSSKFWNPDDEFSYNEKTLRSHDGYAYFLFRADENELHYKKDTNSLSVIVDNAILHKDQYCEVSISDIYSVINAHEEFDIYLNELGYDLETIPCLLSRYDSSGNKIEEKNDLCVGFKTPLETIKFNFEETGYKRGPYVEAVVTHLLNLEKDEFNFYENSVNIESSIDQKEFAIERYYIPNQYNLEVFLNGLKLVRGIDYIEPDKNTPVCKFTIKKELSKNDVIVYRITNPIVLNEIT